MVSAYKTNLRRVYRYHRGSQNP